MSAQDGDPLFLSVDEVLSLHADQLRLFGGSEGIRDRGVLESAVAMPASTFDGVHLHADPFEMAAAYAFHIAEGQPLVDGNKRTALDAALVFLDLNGWLVTDPDMRLYEGMMGFATHGYSKARFAALLRELASPIDDDNETSGEAARYDRDLTAIFTPHLGILSGKATHGRVEVVCNQPSPRTSHCGGTLAFRASSAVVSGQGGKLYFQSTSSRRSRTLTGRNGIPAVREPEFIASTTHRPVPSGDEVAALQR